MKISLADNIDWVGFVDWNVRDFHSYTTSRGATYNAYLIRDEKTALIDTVKYLYAAALQSNISGLCRLDDISYLICNHAEPDHSSALPHMVKACPQATVVCDAKCRETLTKYYDTAGWRWQVVKTGDAIKLGKRALTFIETPMVHWPDSMFTYCPEEEILFSMDAFGQHYATAHRFDDEVDLAEALAEAKKYYANIVMLYGQRIARLLEAAAGMKIKMIAPAHGVIWRRHIKEIIAAYGEWVVCKPRPKALVVYDSMWGSTELMARAIADGAAAEGVEVKVSAVRANDSTDLTADILDAAAVACGTSTLNQGMMPAMAALLTYWKGLRPMGKCGFAFGSFGWGKGGPEAVDAMLREMKFDVLRPPILAQYRPSPEVLEECRVAGRLLAARCAACRS